MIKIEPTSLKSRTGPITLNPVHHTNPLSLLIPSLSLFLYPKAPSQNPIPCLLHSPFPSSSRLPRFIPRLFLPRHQPHPLATAIYALVATTSPTAIPIITVYLARNRRVKNRSGFSINEGNDAIERRLGNFRVRLGSISALG